MNRKNPPLGTLPAGPAAPMAAIDDSSLRQRLDAWLERAFEPLWAPMVWPALIDWCAALRRSLPPEAWAAARAAIAGHEIALLAGEDPWIVAAREAAAGGERMLSHAMIDLALEHPLLPWPRPASPAGRAIGDVMAAMPLALALREQHRLMARLAESQAERAREAAFLTLDAGASREAGMARGQAGGLRWFAQEARPPAGEALPREGLAAALRRRRGAGSLLKAEAGYAFIALPRSLARLSDRQAACLLTQAFERLAPGGVLFASSLTDGLREAAYFEAFAGWSAPLRAEAALGGLLGLFPEAACLRRELLPAAGGGMAHLLVMRSL